MVIGNYTTTGVKEWFFLRLSEPLPS